MPDCPCAQQTFFGVSLPAFSFGEDSAAHARTHAHAHLPTYLPTFTHTHLFRLSPVSDRTIARLRE